MQASTSSKRLRTPELKLKRMLEKKRKTEREKPKPEEEKKILLSKRENSLLSEMVVNGLLWTKKLRMRLKEDSLISKMSSKSSKMLRMLPQLLRPRSKPKRQQSEKPRKRLNVTLEKLRSNGSMTKSPQPPRLTRRVSENTRMLKTKLRSTEKFSQP